MNRNIARTGLLAMLFLIQTFSGLSNDAKKKAGQLALTPEQVEVYRAALTFVLPHAPVKKYLVDRAHGIPNRSEVLGDKCLTGIDLEPRPDPEMTYVIPKSLAKGLAVSVISEDRAKRLDAKEQLDNPRGRKNPAIIAFSGIAFDKGHHFAVLYYIFYDGYETIVLENTGGKWQPAFRRLPFCGKLILD